MEKRQILCMEKRQIFCKSRHQDTFKHTQSKFLHPDKEPPTFSSFQVVTDSEVLKFIKEAPSKTCSLDPFPTHIVKQCIDILLPSLTKLVNLSLENGISPNPFKQAIVTPLLKKSTLSKEDLKSYRPVSGLSFLSKLVERIVAAQIRYLIWILMILVTLSSQPIRWGIQQKLPCCASKMRFT